MQLSSKIAISVIMVVVLTTAILLSIIAVEKQSLQRALSDELDEQIRFRTAEVLQPIYKLCQITEAQTIPLLQKDLKNASHLLARMGGVALGKDYVPWKIIDDTNGGIVELPMMLAGGVWLGQIINLDIPSPIVDDIHQLSGAHCSIYQRVNQTGDMINVGTSIRIDNAHRAIGAYISHQNPDGTSNEMIQAIIQGKKYTERASYANGWISQICEPIQNGEVIGSLCVNISQKDTVDSLRKTILKTAISKSGYAWVIGSKNERRGVYVISKDGERDGENLWDFKDENGNYFVRAIVHKALRGKAGETNFYSYPWKNLGDPHPRMKTAAFTYFEPWDWIIGSSAYEDDFQAPQMRVDSSLNSMLFLTTGVGIALILASIGAGYIVRRTITAFAQEREKQNWLKTNLNELSNIISGEQEVHTLATNILSHFSKTLDGHIATLYHTQENDWLLPIATYGVVDPDQSTSPIQVGEGLIGQAALDKQTLLMKEVPDGYLTISTGFGKAFPKNIIVKPLIYEDEVVGVMQVGSMKQFSDLQRTFTEEAGKAIAIALFTAHSRTKVDELLAQTQEQAKDLERVSSYKSEFLARMSHEIRTPINAVMGLTGIVLKSQLADQQRDYLNKIHIASKNLLNIVNDILDFSKIEAGRIEIDHVSFLLDEVMENLTDLFGEKLNEKDLELVFFIEPDVPRCLKGDPVRLSQILTNLISNAIKFTYNGEIMVRTSLPTPIESQLPKPTLQFQVRDTGIGITPDVVAHLFEPFTQAESGTTRSIEGTGLGLAICQRLVEVMGGTIWVKSTPGKGSSFYFTSLFEVDEVKSSTLHLPDELLGMKSLVIDNNQWSRRMLIDIQESLGFKAIGVTDSKSGLKILQNAAEAKDPYQLVLLDWKLQDCDCIKFAESIFDRPLLSTSPPFIVLMTTTFGLGKLGTRLESSRIHNYLLKPIKASQLYNCVLELLGKKELVVKSVPAPHFVEGVEALKDRRILLVEDNRFNRDVALSLLQVAGLDVDVVYNGLEAVNTIKLAEKCYDAILMDIQMPVMDGFTATKKIRSLPKQVQAIPGVDTANFSPAIPIIALTAHALKGLKEQCLDAGMDDYISKPFGEKQLYSTLLKWIGKESKREIVQPHSNSSKNEPVVQEASEYPSGLSVKPALKRLGGRKELYNMMLELFVPECESAVATISSCLETGDFETATRTAHTVKGHAAAIGAELLRDVTVELENALKVKDPHVDIHYNRFKDVLAEVLENISRHTQKQS